MRFSQLFIPTTKEKPKDATLFSHQYLIRGGFIAQVGAGIYNYLPLGQIVLNRVKSIINEELKSAGCNEVTLGFVTPAELWQESGRFNRYGKELLRFKDRKSQDFVLGPTHEEMMVNLVKGRVKSYKQLPLNLYQINTKFRDEARARFGLLRAREFIMKDGYSFHSSSEDMKREFSLMEQTYSKIFNRLGLDFRVVEADSGAIGGEGSLEFMVLADSGEDDIVVCKECSYSANIEAAKRTLKEIDNSKRPEAEFNKFQTPNVKTIDEVSEFFNVDRDFIVKTVAKKAIFDDREEIVLFCTRGSDELEETKALNSIRANELVDASDEELNNLGGFLGPVGVSSRYIIDSELEGESGLICGANEIDYHFVGVDFSEHLESPVFADLIATSKGDRCPNCQGELDIRKGIEVGHIFQLGDKYSSALGASFLDENGKAKHFVMGTYGVGVSRLLSAIIEQNHDDKGCKWTRATAPFDIDIVISNSKNESQSKLASEIYDSLRDDGFNPILDDRAERFGFKMGDFELIGFPVAIIVGKKSTDGVVEVVDRESLSKVEVNISELNSKLKEIFC